MKLNENGNSANMAMWYKDISFTLDELLSLKGNVTKECWRYLMGKFCKAERDKRSGDENPSNIYNRLGTIFGCTGANMRRVITYSDAIDYIRKHMPETADDILDGNTRLPSVETRALLKMKPHEINKVIERLSSEDTLAKTIVREQKTLRKKNKKRGRPRLIKNEEARISIKDMPTHDPDAHINTLAYTVPSWVGIIERAFDASDLSNVSSAAQHKLSAELEKLSVSVEILRELLMEVVHERF